MDEIRERIERSWTADEVDRDAVDAVIDALLGRGDERPAVSA